MSDSLVHLLSGLAALLIVGAAMTAVLVLPPAASPGRPGATVLVVPGLA